MRRFTRHWVTMGCVAVITVACSGSVPDAADASGSESSDREPVGPTEADAMAAVTAADVTAHLTCTAHAPISDRVIYNASNDPNELLGRPNGYTSRSDLLDLRTGEQAFGASGGAAVEVFANAAEAQARKAYIDSIIESAPMLGPEYSWVHDSILLRVSGALTPEQAAEYESAMSSLPSNGPIEPCEVDLSAFKELTELPDVPQARSVLTPVGSLPDLPTAQGEVAVVLIAEVLDETPTPRSISFVIHNGTEQPVSSVQVSGRAVDSSGSTVGAGRDQGVQPGLILPGGYGIGYVYIGDALPPGTELVDVQVDFTQGLSSYLRTFSLDLIDIEFLDRNAVGSIRNPTEIDAVASQVTVACFSEDGSLHEVTWSAPDRDVIEAGGTSTFSVYTPERCAGALVEAQGYPP